MIGRVTSKSNKPRGRAQFNLRGRLVMVTGVHSKKSASIGRVQLYSWVQEPGVLGRV